MKVLVSAAFFATVILFNPGSAVADSRGEHIGWQVHQPPRFIVSGVLKQNGTQDVIKLIHQIATANDGQQAVTTFANEAKQKYPGYTLISVLATPVPAVGTCENNI